MTAFERTGWRDGEISARHRQWGFNCPAVDLDFVMLEYNHGKACALIEYKHKNAAIINPQHATYRALIDLADNYSPGALPCLVAIYDPKDWSFSVIPLNAKAKKHYSHCTEETLSEARFVRSLYLIRKAVLTEKDEETISKLNSTLHPVWHDA